MTIHAAAAERPRGFRLRVLPNGTEGYGIRLEEADGTVTARGVVVEADAARVDRMLPAVLAAVRTSGYPKTALSPTRRGPITLREEPGVRLALLLLAAGPVRKARRVQDLGDAVAALTAEEAYYWYAKATGPDGPRLQRALRLFLARE